MLCSIHVLVFEVGRKLMLICVRSFLVKPLTFVYFVVCDPQEGGEDGRWQRERKRERGWDGFPSWRPRRFFFLVTAPLRAWLTAAADIATLWLPAIVSSGSREYELTSIAPQCVLAHIMNDKFWVWPKEGNLQCNLVVGRWNIYYSVRGVKVVFC